jgi:hypothetical protein
VTAAVTVATEATAVIAETVAPVAKDAVKAVATEVVAEDAAAIAEETVVAAIVALATTTDKYEP